MSDVNMRSALRQLRAHGFGELSDDELLQLAEGAVKEVQARATRQQRKWVIPMSSNFYGKSTHRGKVSTHALAIPPGDE